VTASLQSGDAILSHGPTSDDFHAKVFRDRGRRNWRTAVTITSKAAPTSSFIGIAHGSERSPYVQVTDGRLWGSPRKSGSHRTPCWREPDSNREVAANLT
jgi:hypothetical protein